MESFKLLRCVNRVVWWQFARTILCTCGRSTWRRLERLC